MFKKGHIPANKVHGLTKTKFHNTWLHIRARCLNKNCDKYKFYGGRGIKVCKRWGEFMNFKEDMYDSYLNHVSINGEKETTIDRIDNDGNYCPENCKWSTFREQFNNRRTTKIIEYKGESKSATEWAREYGLNPFLVFKRLKRGWSIDKALNEPKKINQFG